MIAGFATSKQVVNDRLKEPAGVVYLLTLGVNHGPSVFVLLDHFVTEIGAVSINDGPVLSIIEPRFNVHLERYWVMVDGPGGPA